MTVKGIFKKSSFVLLVLISSCGHKPFTHKDKKVLVKIKRKKLKVSPGHVSAVKINWKLKSKPSGLRCDDKDVPYFIENETLKFLISESYFSKREKYACTVDYKGQKFDILSVKVLPFKFPEESLKVPYRKVVPAEEDKKRIEKEWLHLKSVYESGEGDLLIKNEFKAPLRSYITSIYGTRRIYNNLKKGQHLGTDFRAGIGTPIPVSNRGKVVLSDELFFTGGTIIVDHGLEIFTIYAHLSKRLVGVGDIVQPMDVIGEAGATGRVSGPHLHWGVKVQGHWVDGHSLVKATKDFP